MILDSKQGLLNLNIPVTLWDKIMKKAELEEVSKQGKIFIVKKEEKEWYKNNDCKSCENNEGTELLSKKIGRV